MPIKPLHVQSISKTHTPATNNNTVFNGQTFTNTSSQQMTPGQLRSFFLANNHGQMLNSTELPQHSSLLNQITDMSATKSKFSVDKELFSQTFARELKEKNQQFLTPSMAAWKVPIDKTEMR